MAALRVVELWAALTSLLLGLATSLSLSSSFDHSRSLDETRAGPGANVDIVVARYLEDLHWLEPIPETMKQTMRLLVYNKGWARRPYLPTGFHKASTEIPIANPLNGRETHTFLHHILSNYDALPEWTVFIQGDANKTFPAFTNFLGHYSFKSSPRFECLSCMYRPPLPPADFGNCSSRDTPMTFSLNPNDFQVVGSVKPEFQARTVQDPGLHNYMVRYGRQLKVPRKDLGSHFCKQIGIEPPNGTIDFCYSANFLVHRSRITQHPKAVYEAMLAFLMVPNATTGKAPDVNCIPEKANKGKNCEAYFYAGYLMERMWAYIFGPRPA